MIIVSTLKLKEFLLELYHCVGRIAQDQRSYVGRLAPRANNLAWPCSIGLFHRVSECIDA